MRTETKEKLVWSAMSLFTSKGRLRTTVSDLVVASGFSEMTCMRYFREGLASAYEEVLSTAAEIVLAAYREAIIHQQVDADDPAQIIGSYVEVVIGLWLKGGRERECVMMLYGPGGRTAAKYYLPKVHSKAHVYADLLFLDTLLEKTGADTVKTSCAKCIAIGSLGSFVSSDCPAEAGARMFLDTLRIMLQLTFSVESAGKVVPTVTKTSLVQLANEAEQLAAHIKKLLAN